MQVWDLIPRNKTSLGDASTCVYGMRSVVYAGDVPLFQVSFLLGQIDQQGHTLVWSSNDWCTGFHIGALPACSSREVRRVSGAQGRVTRTSVWSRTDEVVPTPWEEDGSLQPADQDGTTESRGKGDRPPFCPFLPLYAGETLELDESQRQTSVLSWKLLLIYLLKATRGRKDQGPLVCDYKEATWACSLPGTRWTLKTGTLIEERHLHVF